MGCGREAAADRARPPGTPSAARARAGCAAGCQSRWWQAAATAEGRGGRSERSCGPSLGHRIIESAWMMEDERRHRGLGLHHAAVGQLNADVGRTQRLEEKQLILQPGTGRVAERIPL